MTRKLRALSGGPAFPGATALTNKLPGTEKNNLHSTGWVDVAPLATTSVAGQITWNASGTQGRERDQWYTMTEGETFMLVFRCHALNNCDVAGKYYNSVSIRAFPEGGSVFLTDLHFGATSPSILCRDDGAPRNYFTLFTATAANVMYDLFDTPANETARSFAYEVCGLYDMAGLSGWVYDPADPQVRFNLDHHIVWWTDSVASGMAQHISRWLNCYNPHDQVYGGQTAAYIRAQFDANPSLHRHPTIITMGQNSIEDAETAEEIEAHFQHMTDTLEAAGADYRVCTIIPNVSWTNPSAQYTKFTAINTWIKSTYGTKAVDVLQRLQDEADDGLDPDDSTRVAAGVTPDSVRVDLIHLNNRGMCFYLDEVFNSLGKGWYG